MKTFEVHFTIDGKGYKEQISGENTYQAKKLLKMRYSGSRVSITAIYQIK